MIAQKKTFRQQLNLLQVYRGIAAVLVLLFHGGEILSQNFNQPILLYDYLGHIGWIGVDFFFVLSGFIIFYIHKSDIGCPSSLRKFILKRFIRIYPFYWTVLICKLGLIIGFNYQDNFPNLIEVIKNILLYPQENRILGVSWTLSHEIFFYIMFCLLLVLGYKYFMPIGILWLIGIFISWTLQFSIIKETPLLNLIFEEVNLEFLLGCFVAYSILNHQKLIWQYKRFLFCLAAFLLTLYFIVYQSELIDESTMTRIIWALPFGILVAASVVQELSQSLLNIPRFLIYIGNASYSIYLTHGFIVSNLAKIITKLNFISSSPLLTNMLALTIFMITVGLGCTVHSCIEKPLLKVLKGKLVLSKKVN
ncbi:acyltransferase family protein [Coleofasciculus chthonoplastes]|uniref:acyltransferase family protein n=1 Tax=Coleofasciculus chthonoplastes TaxID=64178 RepID=UPI0032F18CEB